MSENENNEAEVVDATEGDATDAAATEVTEDAASVDEAAAATQPAEEGTPVAFGDLPDGGAPIGGGPATLELLYDLSLPLTVELGRAALKVQDVLSLGQGSVVRLDRVAGDPVDVYVGSKKLAQAEVVVLEEQFGIRITHIYPDAGSPDA